jgi:hypothetical protein
MQDHAIKITKQLNDLFPFLRPIALKIEAFTKGGQLANQLQQINCKYFPEEDRIVLEISTSGKTAYRLWLTRRFVQLFWKNIHKSIQSKPAVAQQAEPKKKAVMEFQEKVALENANFKTEYQSVDLTYPQGERPILPTTINYTTRGNLSSYTFKAKDGNLVTFNLNQQLIYSLAHMLMSTTQKAEWGLDLKLTDADIKPPSASSQVH